MKQIKPAQLARLFSGLSNERRVQVFQCLLGAARSGRSFGEIAADTGIPASSLAHHLREMAASGLVLRRAEGARSIFTLDLGLLAGVFRGLMAECCAKESELAGGGV